MPSIYNFSINNTDQNTRGNRLDFADADGENRLTKFIPRRENQMTAQTDTEFEVNSAHVPTRPGLVAYGVLAMIVVLLSIFMLTT